MAILIVIIGYCIYIIYFDTPSEYPVYTPPEPSVITIAEKQTMFAKTENVIKFDYYQKEVNEEIYAWIQIPNTKVNYPVLQSKISNKYYLDRTEKRKKSLYGAIYTENYNTKTFNDYNTIIYGHNMTNETMFGNLRKYKERKFFDEHKTIYIYTPDKMLIYKILAAYTENDDHLMSANDFNNEEGFQKYLDKINTQRKEDGVYDEHVKLTVNDRIITLSTCVGDGSTNKRFLVQAYLDEIYEYN